MPATYVHTSARGHVFALGLQRRPDRNHERHLLRLVPPRSVDRTRARSLAHLIRMARPFDQGAEGSCTANAGALIAAMCDALMGLPDRVYSRELIYWIERELMKTLPQDSGAEVVDEVDAPHAYGGLVEESVWPYDAQPGEAPPSGVAGAPHFLPVAAYQPIAQADYLDGILTALDNEQPVAVGMNWYNGWFADFERLGYLTGRSMDYVAGGHALVIIGYVPPSQTFPSGAWVMQNSWGETSPAVPQLWADSRAGQLLMPVELFAANQVQSDAYAAVAASAPATLSVAVSGPSGLQAGVAGAFAAKVTGLPAGTVVSWAWDFGDGGQAIAANSAHAFAAPGSYAVSCTVSVATTGATARGVMNVSVTAAPGPNPGPGPSGSATATVNTELARETAAFTEVEASDPSNASYYQYASRVLSEWTRPNLDQRLNGQVTRWTGGPPPAPTPQERG